MIKWIQVNKQRYFTLHSQKNLAIFVTFYSFIIYLRIHFVYNMFTISTYEPNNVSLFFQPFLTQPLTFSTVKNEIKIISL